MSYRLRQTIVPLLVIPLASCVAWRRATVPLPELLVDEQPRQIRVTGSDSTRQIIRTPAVTRDSIVTVSETCQTSVAGGSFNCVPSDTTAVMALGDVTLVEVGYVSGLRTVGAVGAALVALFLTALASYGG
jgi:hypothetical protein